MHTVLNSVYLHGQDADASSDGRVIPFVGPKRDPTVSRPERPRRLRLPAGMALFLAVALIAGPGGPVAAQQPEPGAFLKAMVGEWSVETEAIPGPGEDPVGGKSREVARLLGDQWLVSEVSEVMPDGRPYNSMWILGWDPHEEHFVGTWVVSIQTYKWRHTGSLDESGRVLTLETEGPFMGDPDNPTRFREIIELVDDDHRVLRSVILVPGEGWFEFARAEYRREGPGGE